MQEVFLASAIRQRNLRLLGGDLRCDTEQPRHCPCRQTARLCNVQFPLPQTFDAAQLHLSMTAPLRSIGKSGLWL